MKEIIEIVKLSTKRRLRKVEVLNNIPTISKSNNYYRLYKGIIDGKCNNDVSAAHEMFRTVKSDKRYLMLKSRFKKLLLNSLFFLDFEHLDIGDYYKALYKCEKKLFQVKALIAIGARESGVKIALKIVDISMKFELTNILIQTSEILRNIYGILGEESQFEYYDKLLKSNFRILEAENTSDELYRRLIIKFIKSEAMKPELVPIAKQYAKQLKALCRKNDSFVLHFNMYRVWFWSYRIAGNYRSTLRVCEKAEQYMEENPLFSQKIKSAELALIKMNCFMHLQDNKNGFINAEKCDHLFDEDSINRLLFLEYYFLLAMHTGKYVQAVDIFNRAVQHPKYSEDFPKHLEKWRIFEAFLNYISTSEQNVPIALYPKKKKFNLPKFLNELPIYSKDKRGFNVLILIIQVLFLLEKQEYVKIIDRTEALKTYRSRYLRKDIDFRSSCFIKMLLIMEKKDFEKTKTKIHTEPLFQMLKKTRIRYEGSLTELEVIPYEQLWDRILKNLKKS